jgi:predicted nucleic acid-binding Zn ribbon protein
MIRFRCPRCQEELEHPTAGATVSCPGCEQALQVPAAGALPTASQADLPEVVLLPEERPAPRSRLRRPERTCPECGTFLPPRARFCPECDIALARRLRRREMEPHRGTLILVLGILSLVMAQIILGPIAWVMGTEDLKKIRAGKMDPDGESNTNTGRICGMIGTILGAVGLAVVVVFFCFWMSLFTAIVGHHR